MLMAPGTFASANAKRMSSTSKRCNGPPRAFTVPVIRPRHAYGNGMPLNWRSSAKSSGSARRSTFVSVMTGPPTPHVMRPRRCESWLRASMFVSAYFSTLSFAGSLRISRSIDPPPSVGNVCVSHEMSRMATFSPWIATS